jgi:SPP1 gp7 family putative phage head morphogenesis protein
VTSFIPAFVETHENIARETGKRFRVKRPTRQLVPRGVERSFAADLVRIIIAIRDDINEFLIPEIGRLSRLSELRGDAERQDIEDISAIIDTIEGELSGRLDNRHLRNVEELVQGYFNDTSSFSRRQTARQIRRMIGVEAFPQERQLQTMLSTFLRENVSLIKSLTGDYVTKVTDIVRRRVRAGDRPETIQQDIRKRFKVSRNRARLIARDQTNKLNGALTRMRQTSLGIDEYIWRTSRDERVRESHLEKEGRKFRWDRPPADTGHPGQDINCRCNAEPVIKGVPPPQENRREVIREVKRKRERLREKLKGKKAARLIARG